MKNIRSYLSVLSAAVFLYSCSKSSNDHHIQISSQEFHAGTYIQNGDTLNSRNKSNGRAIKGTLKAEQTYYLASDYAAATAIGVQDHAPGIDVNGNLLSQNIQ